MEYIFTITKKKIILSISILTVLCFYVNGQTKNPSIAKWNFDEKTGLMATDATGNGHDGTLLGFQNDDSQWVSGKHEGAIEFDGNSYIQVPDFNIDTLNGTFTVAFWMKTDTTTTIDSDIEAHFWHGAFLLDKAKKGNGFSVANHYSKIVFQCNTVKVIAPTHIDDGVWHHVAIMRNLNGSLSVYIDGKLDITSTNTDKEDMISSVPLIIGASTSPSASWNNSYVGDLDDVEIFNYALTVDEVTALSNMTSTIISR